MSDNNNYEENANVFYDQLAWRADSVANLVRAAAELLPVVHNAAIRAELVLMMKVIRKSIESKPNTSHVAQVIDFISKVDKHAKPVDVGPRGGL